MKSEELGVNLREIANIAGRAAAHEETVSSLLSLSNSNGSPVRVLNEFKSAQEHHTSLIASFGKCTLRWLVLILIGFCFKFNNIVRN